MSPDEALALDWALGAVDRDERIALELRRARDPAFRALCDAWAAQLAPLSESVAPVAPSEQLWDRIAAETNDAPRRAPAPAAPSAASRALAWWRGLAVAGAGAAALAVALLATRPAEVVTRTVVERPAGGFLSATLSGEGGTVATAAYDSARQAVLVAPLVQPDAARDAELWVIPADGTPRSLGVVPPGRTATVPVSPEVLRLVADGATLAISLEPRGGSPTGAPTGPVIATGKLTRV
jgi:anti-sigma-K factor RskA